MTEVGLAMPGSSMDDGRHFYPSHGSYMDNYVLPGPSVYPPVYEPNTPPPSTYPAMGGLHSTSSEEWAGQEMSLSPGEREKAKNRRREQNRASQRAYRKRKEDNVKGLYESIKDLRRESEILRTENSNLKTELKKLHEENHILRSRASSLQSCQQCLDADVSCSKTNVKCIRCEEARLTCNSPLPRLISRYPTTEASDHEDNIHDSVYDQITAKPNWYHSQAQAHLVSQSITMDGIPAYGVSSYGAQEFQSRYHTPYKTEDDDELFQESLQGDYTNFLQPTMRQIHRSQSLQNLAVTSDQLRPRSSSLFRPSVT